MRPPAALALVVLVVITAGCGGGHRPTSREHVTAYIARVNAVEVQLRAPIGKAQQAVTEFSGAHFTAATVTRLAQAQATLATLHRRLVAMTPPPQARKLHRLLVALVAREQSLVSELHALTLFDPRFVAALRPLAAANASSREALQHTTDPVAVAAVVGRYRTAVRRSLDALRKLAPPPVQRPTYDAQVARLVALDASLRRLSAAVVAKNATAAARAEHAVSVASVSSDSTANQLAQRNAVRAYDTSVRALATLEHRILLERNRLQVSLK